MSLILSLTLLVAASSSELQAAPHGGAVRLAIPATIGNSNAAVRRRTDTRVTQEAMRLLAGRSVGVVASWELHALAEAFGVEKRCSTPECLLKQAECADAEFALITQVMDVAGTRYLTLRLYNVKTGTVMVEVGRTTTALDDDTLAIQPVRDILTTHLREFDPPRTPQKPADGEPPPPRIVVLVAQRLEKSPEWQLDPMGTGSFTDDLVRALKQSDVATRPAAGVPLHPDFLRSGGFTGPQIAAAGKDADAVIMMQVSDAYVVVRTNPKVYGWALHIRTRIYHPRRGRPGALDVTTLLFDCEDSPLRDGACSAESELRQRMVPTLQRLLAEKLR